MLLAGLLFAGAPTSAKKTVPADSAEAASNAFLDSLTRFEAAIPYQTGTVDYKDIVSLKIPKGYKFIPQKEAQTIVTDFWKNPADPSVIGLLVPESYSLTHGNDWAFVLSYTEDGYVKDEDAKDLDYDQMMKDMQADEESSNKLRRDQGYENVYIKGWAAKPFYDNQRKMLHWAKKIQFGDEALAPDELTLNYDVRVLGRKGVLSMNAVASMGQLDSVNKHIPDVLAMASFKSGNAYSDFNPSMDKVAAYTVGGLIAGKLLAKTGILLLLLKNIKLVLLAIGGLFAAFRKKLGGLFSRKKEAAAPDLSDYYPNRSADSSQTSLLSETSTEATPIEATQKDTSGSGSEIES